MTAYNSCGCQSLTSCEPDMVQYCCWTMKEAAHHQHTRNCSSSNSVFQNNFKIKHRALSLENMNKVHLNGHKTIWAISCSTLAFKYNETVSTQCLSGECSCRRNQSCSDQLHVFLESWILFLCLHGQNYYEMLLVFSAISFRKGHFFNLSVQHSALNAQLWSGELLSLDGLIWRWQICAAHIQYIQPLLVPVTDCGRTAL